MMSRHNDISPSYIGGQHPSLKRSIDIILRVQPGGGEGLELNCMWGEDPGAFPRIRFMKMII